MVVKFREKAQREEDDYQELLAIQREQDRSFGGRCMPNINPGPVVPMSPLRPRPAPLFVSTSASTSMPSSSFRPSRYGTPLDGASTVRATIPFPSPTLSNVQTRFTRFGPQTRPLATTSRVRSPTVSDPEPLESLATLFPVPSLTEVNPPTSPTPSVALTELVDINDGMPTADDIAFLDDRDTNTIINEFPGEPSDAESEAIESVTDNSSENTFNSAEEENQVVDPDWTPEGQFQDDGMDVSGYVDEDEEDFGEPSPVSFLLLS